MGRRCKIVCRLSDVACANKKINRALIEFYRSWREVNKLINAKDCKEKCK